MEETRYHTSANHVQGLVIGEQNTIIQYFTDGISSFSLEYSARIQNFLIEYLGVPHRTIPFGGREADIDFLNAWITSSQISPYLLLAAPAGRGKSALLVHWLSRLAGRNDLNIVFLPISIRFRTNLASVVFAALTARLAKIHGEKAPGNPDTPLEVWRGLVIDYLTRPLPDGQSLLLVLDGVDEAADWEIGPDLFPLAPPKGLRIVLSARYLAGDTDATSWLRRAGWDRPKLGYALNLYPLTNHGVADVLQHMAFPLDQLGTRTDIVGELHRLSEGDPLLVRLYVDDLWERGEAATRLRPEELSGIRPGLEGYFDRWWEDQRRLWGRQAPLREPTVQAFLNLLACALGPLETEVVLHLIPSEIHLTSWTLQEILQSLSRFVIGDGRSQGYTFSHPRLGFYFYEKLARSEQQTVELQFLKWGTEILDRANRGNMPLEHGTPYIIQYYGAHLERMGQPAEAFLPLISDGWRRVWEVLEGGAQAGFLNDVGRVWKAVEKDNQRAIESGYSAKYIPYEICCALCWASVNSLAKNIPPALLITLVEKGIWTPTQGLAYAREAPDPKQKAMALVGIAACMTEPQKMGVLQEALEATQAIQDGRLRISILSLVLPSCSPLMLHEVMQRARETKNEYEIAETLIDLAPFLPLSLHREALDVTQALQMEEYRANVLVELAPFLSNLLLQEGVEIARSIKNQRNRVQVLLKIAPYLSEILFSQVLDMIQALQDERERAEALATIVSHLPQHLVSKALKAIQDIHLKWYRIQALARISRYLPIPLFRETLFMIGTFNNDKEIAALLKMLVPSLPEQLQEEALFIAHKIRNEKLRVEMLRTLIPTLSKEMLPKTLQSVQSIRDEGLRISFLVTLIPRLSNELQLQTRQVGQAIADPGLRAWILGYLIQYLPTDLREKQIQDVLQTIEKIKSNHDREMMLRTLMPFAPEELLQGIVKAIQSMKGEADKASILAIVAPSLPEASISDALAITRAFSNQEQQAQVLAALAPSLPQTALIEALAMTRAFSNQEQQAQVLVALAPSLPQTSVSDALTITRAFTNQEQQAQVLVALASSLPQTALIEALAITRAFSNQEQQAQVLAALAPFLPRGLLLSALEIARTIGDKETQEQELVNLVLALPPFEKARYPQEVFDALNKLGNEDLLTQNLIEMIPYLSEMHFEEVLEIVGRMTNSGCVARVLKDLVPRLPEKQLANALKLSGKILEHTNRVDVFKVLLSCLSDTLFLDMMQALLSWNDKACIEMLTELAPHLSKTQVSQALQMIVRSIMESKRTNALIALLPFLADPQFSQIFDIIMRTGNDQGRLQVLTALAPRLSEAQAIQAFQLVIRGKLEPVRTDALMALLPYLPQNHLGEVFDMVVKSGKDQQYLRVLDALTPHLSESQTRQAMQLIVRNKMDLGYTNMLTALLPFLSQTQRNRMFDIIAKLDKESETLQGLTILAPYLSQEQVDQALQRVVPSKWQGWDTDRTDALTALLPFLSQTQRNQIFDIIAKLDKESETLRGLTVLAPYLSQEQVNQALQSVALSGWRVRDTDRADTLIALLPSISSESQLAQLFTIIQSTANNNVIEQVLSALAPRLSETQVDRVLEIVQRIENDNLVR